MQAKTEKNEPKISEPTISEPTISGPTISTPIISEPRKSEVRQEEAPQFAYTGTPYIIANLAAKTAAISFTVSTFTQPLQAVLTQVQMPAGSPGLSGGLFRGLYRGFGSYAMAGQKRGAVAVTSKQANNKEGITEEEMEAELPFHSKWGGTLAFAQADFFISNGLSGESKLKNAGILTPTNYKRSFYNFYQLTLMNYGSRSVAGFTNFAAIGFVGDKFCALFNYDEKLLNKILGGATAGVFATFLTTIPNAFADRKLLETKVENKQILTPDTMFSKARAYVRQEGVKPVVSQFYKRLLTASPYTMFSNAQAYVRQAGVKPAMPQFAMNYLKEVAIRSPLSALTFAIIMGMDHVMGLEPLKDVWPSTEPSNPPSKRM